MARIILTSGTEIKVRESLDDLYEIVTSNLYGPFVKLNQYQFVNVDFTDSLVIVNVHEIKVIFE